MASATSLTVLHDSRPSFPTKGFIQAQPSQAAIDWAQKFKQQLALIADYEEVESVPRSIVIDEIILNAPRRRAADPVAAKLAEEIADILYPTQNGVFGPITKYEKDLVKLRKLVIMQRKHIIEDNTKRNALVSWEPRILKQGAWDPVADPVSLGGAPSLPMPVEIAKPETLEPFFKHLANGGTGLKSSSEHAQKEAVEIEEPAYHIPAVEFERGVAYSDGRMDLCKMVLGPNNIGALMESLKPNKFVTHFLLGNNIIGPHGAKCIANFLKEYPNRMDTWYLAGNCIDAPSFKLLVDAWTHSESVTNIWLKRNPLGPFSAGDVFRLITQTANLRTLDLDQTELGDAGVAELFQKLADFGKPVALRHIYLSAVGIGANGAAGIAKYLASPHCELNALYLTNNPLGDEGVTALAAGVTVNQSLTRLTLASVGVRDEGIISLCNALEDHTDFMTLEIGQSYATEDLGSKYNWITDRSAFAIHNLINSAPNLKYLNIAQSALTNLGLSTILETIPNSNLQFYRASTIYPQARDPAAINAGQAHAKLAEQANATLLKNVRHAYGADTAYSDFMNDQKRWLVSDKTDVRKIDSVYRNRDAGLARRGVKKLEKWWNEDDETLKDVMGAVGPVCTMRKRKTVKV